MRKKFFSSLLAVLILFWAIGMTSYSQDKTEKEQTKTEKVVKKVPVDNKKSDINKVSVVSKDKMTHKHYKKSGKVSKDKMIGKKKTDSTDKEKGK